MTPPSNPVDLVIWHRTVAEMYAFVRQTWAEDHPDACDMFRAERDRMFKEHPQSPLSEEQAEYFTYLEYYPYDPAWRVTGTIDTGVKKETFTVDLPDEGAFRYTRIARVRFQVLHQEAELSLFWVEGYGGGLFLPFKDETNGEETYGGGRYLYDTVKGADLRVDPDELVLDFNYAYNPSCAYNDRWVSPLSPAENTLPFPVEAGEKAFIG
jgi:uncharacterized protein (DUF1684 family)